MLRLKHPDVVPPGGRWVWDPNMPGVQPIVGSTFRHLASRVEIFKTANGLDLSDGWRERLEADICVQLNLDSNWCNHREPPADGATSKVGFHQVVVFLKVLKDWIFESTAGGEPQWVSQEEADARALTCSQCPNNIAAIGGCAACADLLSKAVAIIGQRKTKYDNSLRACGVCGCDLKAIAHVPLSILAKGENEEQAKLYSSFCWKKDAIKLKT